MSDSWCQELAGLTGLVELAELAGLTGLVWTTLSVRDVLFVLGGLCLSRFIMDVDTPEIIQRKLLFIL
jgi:hypothetical protein